MRHFSRTRPQSFVRIVLIACECKRASEIDSLDLSLVTSLSQKKPLLKLSEAMKVEFCELFAVDPKVHARLCHFAAVAQSPKYYFDTLEEVRRVVTLLVAAVNPVHRPPRWHCFSTMCHHASY
eukprot:6469714-Amphidinium_carterae.3